MPSLPVGPKGQKRRVSFNVVYDLGVSNPTVAIPPLYMQYNPQNWNQTYKKLVTRSQTIAAYIEEYWGDELDTITANAVTGSFMTFEEGLTTYHRKESPSYHKFQDVLDIYNNNGNTYDGRGVIKRKGGIVLFFDPGTYIGYFENFNYTEDSSNPYRFSFDFTFKVLKSYTGF